MNMKYLLESHRKWVLMEINAKNERDRCIAKKHLQTMSNDFEKHLKELSIETENRIKERNRLQNACIELNNFKMETLKEQEEKKERKKMKQSKKRKNTNSVIFVISVTQS